MAEPQALVEQDRRDRERFSDQFVGDLLAVARVSVSGAKLDQLLDASIVAEKLPELPRELTTVRGHRKRFERSVLRR